MIDKQAEIITKNRQTMNALAIRIEQLEAKLAVQNTAAEAWRAMQKQIVANPTLQSEWDRFLGFLRLAGDEEYLKINFRERRT